MATDFSGARKVQQTDQFLVPVNWYQKLANVSSTLDKWCTTFMNEQHNII